MNDKDDMIKKISARGMKHVVMCGHSNYPLSIEKQSQRTLKGGEDTDDAQGAVAVQQLLLKRPLAPLEGAGKRARNRRSVAVLPAAPRQVGGAVEPAPNGGILQRRKGKYRFLSFK